MSFEDKFWTVVLFILMAIAMAFGPTALAPTTWNECIDNNLHPHAVCVNNYR